MVRMMQLMMVMMVEVLFSEVDAANDGGSVGLVRMMQLMMLMMVEVLV